MRLNKEIKIDYCNNIDLKVGTVNNYNPQVIYFIGKMWICPTYEGDYEENFNLIKNKFKKDLKNILKENDIFEYKHIVDFDVNPNNFVKNKKKFVSMSIFIKQKDKNNFLKFKQVVPNIIHEFESLFKDFETSLIENDFVVSKRK